MPLVSWTERDELLSDALHMRDVAMGLADPNPRWVEDALEAGDPAFVAHITAAGGWDWQDASAHQFEQALETWQRRNEPVLTADSKAHPHDAEHVPTIRWTDGAACSVYIELERKAEAELLVEPIRDYIADLDIQIEEARADGIWVGDLEEQREYDVRTLALVVEAAEEGVEFPTLSEPTVPTPERCRAYAAAMLATGRGAIASTTTIEGVGSFPTRAVYDSVKADVAKLAERRRRRAGRPQGKATAKASGMQAPSTVEWRLQRRREARRELMPMQRPVVTSTVYPLPALDEGNLKASCEQRQAKREHGWEAVFVTRIKAGLRMLAYQRGEYRPLG